MRASKEKDNADEQVQPKFQKHILSTHAEESHWFIRFAFPHFFFIFLTLLKEVIRVTLDYVKDGSGSEGMLESFNLEFQEKEKKES